MAVRFRKKSDLKLAQNAAKYQYVFYLRGNFLRLSLFFLTEFESYPNQVPPQPLDGSENRLLPPEF